MKRVLRHLDDILEALGLAGILVFVDIQFGFRWLLAVSSLLLLVAGVTLSHATSRDDDQ